MNHKPGDVWIAEKWSFDTPSRKYYTIHEMTGAGVIHWQGIYEKRENAQKEIDACREIKKRRRI